MAPDITIDIVKRREVFRKPLDRVYYSQAVERVLREHSASVSGPHTQNFGINGLLSGVLAADTYVCGINGGGMIEYREGITANNYVARVVLKGFEGNPEALAEIRGRLESIARADDPSQFLDGPEPGLRCMRVDESLEMMERIREQFSSGEDVSS